MNIYDLLETNNIAIVVQVDLKNKRFEILKKDIALESYDLFEQIILFNNVDNLVSSVKGQILPRIWT